MTMYTCTRMVMRYVIRPGVECQLHCQLNLDLSAYATGKQEAGLRVKNILN